MKAVLFSYKCPNKNKVDASKISKMLVGYKDSSNKGNYEYKREGIIKKNKGIIVSKSTFIIPKANSDKIVKEIRKKGASVSVWEIDLPKKYLK